MSKQQCCVSGSSRHPLSRRTTPVAGAITLRAGSASAAGQSSLDHCAGYFEYPFENKKVNSNVSSSIAIFTLGRWSKKEIS